MQCGTFKRKALNFLYYFHSCPLLLLDLPTHNSILVFRIVRSHLCSKNLMVPIAGDSGLKLSPCKLGMVTLNFGVTNTKETELKEFC